MELLKIKVSFQSAMASGSGIRELAVCLKTMGAFVSLEMLTGKAPLLMMDL